MSIPTNEEVYEAIARVLTCRDTRRGRKPSFLVTIITGEDGKTIVTDHNTGCTAAIGKRKYKKRAFTAPTKAAVPSVKRTVTVTDNGVRISPITGKPVRKYTKRTRVDSVTPPPAAKIEKTYKQSLEEQLSEIKEQRSKALIAKEAIAGNPDKVKTLVVYHKVIDNCDKMIAELSAKLATI